MWYGLLTIGAYLLGSLSSAILVCRLMGLPDPRQEGSKNPGTTNVLRLGGKKAAAVTLLGDVAKGLIPVLIAQALEAPEWVLALTTLAAFLGHLYPIFFRFQGGKGVATALGVFLGLDWRLGAAAALTWIAVALVFRISSLSALVAALLAPLYTWWITASPTLAGTITLVSALLVWRHQGNVQRLLAGTEKRLGQ